jgi:hypothetical protein
MVSSPSFGLLGLVPFHSTRLVLFFNAAGEIVEKDKIGRAFKEAEGNWGGNRQKSNNTKAIEKTTNSPFTMEDIFRIWSIALLTGE